MSWCPQLGKDQNICSCTNKRLELLTRKHSIYKNSLSDSFTQWSSCRISAQKAALNRRTQKRGAAFVKTHSLQKGWTVEKWQKFVFIHFYDESFIELHPNHHKYCKTAFFAVPDDFINNLFESLPRRMDAVLQAHRSHSPY